MRYQKQRGHYPLPSLVSRYAALSFACFSDALGCLVLLYLHHHSLTFHSMRTLPTLRHASVHTLYLVLVLYLSRRHRVIILISSPYHHILRGHPTLDNWTVLPTSTTCLSTRGTHACQVRWITFAPVLSALQPHLEPA